MVFVLVIIMRLESMLLRRDVIDGELHAVELVDAVRLSSRPEYQGMAGVRGKELLEEEAEEEAFDVVRLRKLPLRL